MAVQESGRDSGDQPGDLLVELADLGVQGEPAAPKGAQSELSGAGGAEADAGTGQVLLAQSPQADADGVVAADQQSPELVGGLGAGLDRAAAGDDQTAQLTDDAVAVLGDGVGLASQHGPGGMLGIQGIVLADPAPPGPVGPIDLPDRDAVGQQVAGQAVAKAAGAFHSGGDRLAVLAGPGQQPGVAGVAGREAGRGQMTAEGIQRDG